MTTPDLILAKPALLRRFRDTAEGMAEGLEIRRGALDDAIAHHRVRTEAGYRLGDVDELAGDVRRLAVRLRDLGEWVGEVGNTFDGAGWGVPGVLVAVAPGAAAGAASFLPRLAADKAGDAGNGAPRPTGGLGPAIDAAAAGQIGLEEGVHRWSSEPDREPVDRATRAVIDGALAAGGAFGGAATGGAVGSAVCAPFEAAVPTCVAGASYLGGVLGRRAGEWLSDRLLGDEPEVWDRPPEAFAAEIADPDATDDVIDALQPVVDEASSAAAEAAERHADFVMAHPWTWDDDHPDAPHHDPPPPSPVQPATGPR